ncbi:MAG: hypothetical protein QXO69_03385 [archaeon]
MVTQARLARIKELIEWLNKTSCSRRADSLEAFARAKKVSYETVKNDAIALGYAVTPGFDIRTVPRSHRREARALREAIRRGEISEADAGASVFDFIMMNPVSDVERLNRLYPLNDKYYREMQGRIAEMAQKIAEAKVERGTHPVRAQSEAWRDVGNKIHNEIEEAVRTLPAGELENAVREIWENNFLRMQAELNYARGQTKAVNRLGYELSRKNKGISMPIWWRDFLVERYGKEKVEKMTPEEIFRRMQSDYKNLKRHSRPGKERGVPKDFKTALKKIKNDIKYREFSAAGRHYHAGDVIWKELKEKEKSLPEKLRSGRKKR